MTRRRNPNHALPPRKHNNILPVMPMTTEKAPADRLVLLKVVLVHDGAVPVVAPLARVGVAVFQLGAVAAAALRGGGGAFAGVGSAGGGDGCRVVAAVCVEVQEGLEGEFEGVVRLREVGEDVALGWRQGVGCCHGEEAKRGDEELVHLGRYLWRCWFGGGWVRVRSEHRHGTSASYLNVDFIFMDAYHSLSRRGMQGCLLESPRLGL